MPKQDQLGYYTLRFSVTPVEYKYIHQYCSEHDMSVSSLLVAALNSYFDGQSGFIPLRRRIDRSKGFADGGSKDEPLYNAIREWALQFKFTREYTQKIVNVAYRLNCIGIPPETARTMSVPDMIIALAEGTNATIQFIRVYQRQCHRYSDFLQTYHPAPKEATA